MPELGEEGRLSNETLFNRGISCRHDKAYLRLVIVWEFRLCSG